jgi:hypothetical protein
LHGDAHTEAEEAVYESIADFWQDVFASLLAAACDFEIPLEDSNNMIAKCLSVKTSQAEQPTFHCFVTKFDEQIIRTLLSAVAWKVNRDCANSSSRMVSDDAD